MLSWETSDAWTFGFVYSPGWVDDLPMIEDEMELEDRTTKLDSVVFSDLQVSYNPPVCFSCGVIGLSNVSHDLPGRIGYVKLSYEIQ